VRHLCCLQRLIWVQSPSFGARLRSVAEYFHLTRLQRRIMERGGLYAELTRLLDAPEDGVRSPIDAPEDGVRSPIDAPEDGVRSPIGPSETSQRSADIEEVQQRLQPLRPARWVHPTAMCLARSLRILEILRAAGIGEGACLKVGIRPAAIGFRGHAWVDYNGVTLLEDQILEDEYEHIWRGMELLHRPGVSGPPTGAYRAKEGVLVRQFEEDEAVLLDVMDGACFGLHGPSYRIWQEIVQMGTVDASVRQIARETGADIGVVRTDVEEFLGEMIGAGLVRSAV